MTLKEDLKLIWSGAVKWDCDMAAYTTIGVGGQVNALVEPENTGQLSSLLIGFKKYDIPWLILGRGSNILVADAGIEGVVVLLGKKFEKITVDARGKDLEGAIAVNVQAGCSLARLIRYCAKKDVGGLEFAAGIPGSVGGAVAMNAGAWGHDIGEVVNSVELLTATGEVLMQNTRFGDFTYRHWRRPAGSVICSVNLLLQPSERRMINSKCSQLVAKRRQKQPHNYANCGSFFKNPVGEAAGWLIEQASMKGLTVGKAQVSAEHANFLVNLGGATADDFFNLAVTIREKVMAQHGIRLEPEVKFVGRWSQKFSSTVC